MRIERSTCLLTMLVKRSMLTVRIERSICSLTMLVERSMLTMRIQRASRLQCLSKGAFLQCVSRGASVRFQCLSKGACLQCVSRGASVRLQDGCSRLFWFAEDSGLFWSDGLTRAITECIYLYQDDSLDFILQRRGREGDYARALSRLCRCGDLFAKVRSVSNVDVDVAVGVGDGVRDGLVLVLLSDSKLAHSLSPATTPTPH